MDRLEQFRKFVAWEREHTPYKTHIAEWALHEIERLRAMIRPSAPVGVDEFESRLRGRYGPFTAQPGERYVDADIALAVLREALSQQPAAPVLAKHQPCGCVICTCEDERQCQGCGAKHCGNRTDHPPYVVQQPAAVDEARVGRAIDAFKRALPAGEAFKLASIPHLALNHAMRAALATQHQEQTT